MILVAVITGYILGAIPFVLPKIIESKNTRTKTAEEAKEDKEQQEILDEWLNGPKQKGINQEDIYKEYITGKETTKGD